MNRRELFKGLGAVLVASSIPITVEALIALPDSEIIRYLRRVQQDLINKIVNPPMLMAADGTVTVMPQDVQQDALRHVDKLLKELAP